MQSMTNQFWKTWQKLFFPTLLIRQKWHHERRNLEIGDVCMLQDSNNLRGEWRICKVVKIHPGEDNIVRNVEVEVAARYDGSLPNKHQNAYTVSRHVSKLIVIADVEEETQSSSG